MEEQQTPAEKDTPLSSQVLEYYRTYSQSVQLPRYLCGEVPNATVVSELLQEPKFLQDIQNYDMVRRPPLIGQDHATTIAIPPTIIITDINSDNRGQVSPTSSVASNRKLEWDNGADIGYENCEAANRSLFRSCSLPALNTLERNIQKDFLRHSPDGRIAETPSQNNIARKKSDLSTTKIQRNLTSSSTTISNDNQNRIASSSSGQCSSIIVSSKPRENVYTSSSSSGFDNSNIIDKRVIYVPVLVDSEPLAESTPNLSEKQTSKDTIYYETPVMTHPRKPPRKNALFMRPKTPIKSKSSSFDDLQNPQKLDETLVNRNKYFQKYLIRKQQNLCITKPASVEYVVNKSLKDNVSIAIQTEKGQSPKRELIYLDHYISDKDESSSSDNSSKIVDCNSFEYLYGSAIEQAQKCDRFEDIVPIEVPPQDKVQADNQIANAQEIVQTFFSDKSKHSKAKSDLTNVTPTESVSSDSKSEKICAKLSQNLISDVEKSVDLLSRLLSSKKYDESAKKYYIRKIVRKIVDSKYIDDKTSMTSSSGTNKTTNESNTSVVDEEKYQKQSKIEPPLISAQRQIKSETNLQEMTDIYPRLQRNPRFTLTNNEFSVGNTKHEDNDQSSSDLFRPHSRHVFPSYTTDSSMDKMQDTNRSSQSWKDDKTASERLIESQTPITEDSDELVGFAQRERKSQLNWISNEINHLSKLKSLLEKKERRPGTTQSTAVYMITTDKNSNGSSRRLCNCSNRLNIPNVISATKTPAHHHIKLQCCNHNQQEYKVRQVYNGRSQCNHRGNTLPCKCYEQYTRNYQRTIPPSTSAMPTSSEAKQNISIPANEEKIVSIHNSEEEKIQEDIDLEIKNPVYNSTGITCNLLPTRAAIVATEQVEDPPKVQRNIEQFESSKDKAKSGNLPKCTSVPTSLSASPKQQPAKISVKSKHSNRNVPAIPPKGEISTDITNNAKLISSEIYQSNEYPTTSVRRYVFEIPIVDLQSHQADLIKNKSSNLQDIKQKDTAPVQNVDFEVRNVHLSQNSKVKQKEREGIIAIQKKKKINKIRHVKHSNSAETPRPLSAKVLSHNQVASFQIKPSSIVSGSANNVHSSTQKSTNHTMKSSLTGTTSILPEVPVTIKTNEHNKITQTDEVRLKEVRESADTQRDLNKKSGNEEGSQISTGSQTLSLENYMKKLIADTMGVDNWTGRKISLDIHKTTYSDKQSIIQPGGHTGNIIPAKPDSSTKRKLPQKQIHLISQSSADEYQITQNSQQSSSKDQQDHSSNTVPFKYNPQDIKSKQGALNNGKNNTTPTERDDSQSNSSESKVSSDTSSATRSTDETIKICQCCRTNSISIENIFARAIHHPLCQTCFQIHQYSLWKNHQPFYMYPNHICNCYTLLKTEQIESIKSTVKELQNLEYAQLNVCACPPHIKIQHQQDNKCLNCKHALKSVKHNHNSTKSKKSTIKSHGRDGQDKQSGISYTLKLEGVTEDDIAEDKDDEKVLGRYEEEVTLKIPNGRDGIGTNGSLDNGRKKDNGRGKENDTVEGENRNDGGKKKSKKNKTKMTKTLQEYLSSNRPTFIESAEQRRKCLIELAYMREERCQKYKQLLAMTNGVPVLQMPQNNGVANQKPRFFSTKEMKRLTAKNYKKLPEVQQRMLDNKERQLKKANRLLSNIFNKKLRDKVLKGQPSLSTSVSVINLM